MTSAATLSERRYTGAANRVITKEQMVVGRAAVDTFIGRRHELAVLEEQLQRALDGHGGMAMLVGEPGIGKTRIARELGDRARARGATVLWGRCYEGEWASPYGPWAEALADCARELTPDERCALGPTLAPLAGLAPELRDALGEAPRAAALGAEEERVRLYDAVVQLLLSLARQGPVLVVLDDLHWADRGSLGLLRHVAHFLDRAGLFIIGTYRDVELDRAHPLAALLPTLRHEADFERLALRGLDDAEAAAHLAQVARGELATSLAGAIRAEAAGNPFYLGQVFRHLLEEGKLVRTEGRWDAAPDAQPWGVPEGVREVVERRLGQLRPETRRLLELGAAFTAGFDFTVLRALSGVDEATGLDAIDEALGARLIHTIGATPARYDFVHALVRHTLYDALNPDRRARLHRRAARALEALHADRARAHAAELAYQYHASAALPGAEAGIPWCLAAAEQALAASAPEQAVAFLRMARDLAAESPAPLRADILRRLAVAEAESLMLDQSPRTAEAALVALAEAGVGPHDAAAFVIEVVRALKDGGAHHTVWEPLVQRGLAALGAERGLLWARLVLLHDPVEMVAVGAVNGSRWLGFDPEAVAVARREGDEDDYARTLEPFGGRSRRETDETLALAARWSRPTAALRALSIGARELLYRHGAPVDATEHLRALLAAAERAGSLTLQAEALVHLANAALPLGDFEVMRRATERARALVDRLGSVHRLRGVLSSIDIILAYYVGGDWPALVQQMTQAHGTVYSHRNTLGLTGAAFTALGYAHAGDVTTARGLLATVVPLLQRTGATAWTHNGALTGAAATAWDLEDAEHASVLLALALHLIAGGVGDFPLLPTAVSAARMATLAGQPDLAATHFAAARAALDPLTQRPQRAIVDFDEAIALVRAGAPEHARVVALFDGALAEFRALGMAPWVERAARREQALIAARRGRAALPAAPDGLTPREVEVLRLIAGGRTNTEIAQTLVLSVRTVERHITNIYEKIGARGRAEATAYAFGRRLADPPR